MDAQNTMSTQRFLITTLILKPVCQLTPYHLYQSENPDIGMGGY